MRIYHFAITKNAILPPNYGTKNRNKQYETVVTTWRPPTNLASKWNSWLTREKIAAAADGSATCSLKVRRHDWKGAKEICCV